MIVSQVPVVPQGAVDARLEVEAVHKAYGRVPALAGVTLSARAGEVLGLLGANGAGKTTLVGVVSGLLRADAGAVRIAGTDVRRAPAVARRLVGVAPQVNGVYEVCTVRENLTFFGELCGLRRRALRERVDAVATGLMLDPLMSRPASQLSGGEKRRLHTAIALVGRPPLLLLDEPTVGADVATRVALLAAVRALADEGSAVVYTTHYLAEIEALRASVAILVRGRTIASGRVDDLIAQHGVAVAELRFDGAAPACVAANDVVRDGDVLRLTAHDPVGAVASVIAGLGPDAQRLRGVEVVRPSLESVFLTLTGRRYDAEEEGHHARAS